MSTSKDGNDPKGKSVETAITNTSPWVLIVENCQVDCFVTSYLLRGHNVQVIAAQGPWQALELLNAEHNVKLILSNYWIPNMTGYDLLMEVKKSPKLSHLPVVITSFDKSPKIVKKCLDGGAKDYIMKPIKYGDVPRILRYI
ncbi:two-component response regulator ORR12-like [Miscanthus floridulus]|uniref:two-component response regulator ORR12-like n=1 Tax=Miscanthus floridulus TaxID=154761 RepID=UPI00345996A4